MSGDGPLEPDDDGTDPQQNPFGFLGLPFLGDLGKLLGGAGDQVWENARQMARAIASEGTSEPNVDPTVRVRYEELARIAELHVQSVTGLRVPHDGADPVQVVTRSEWASRTVDDFRPVFDALGDAFSMTPPADLPADDPTAQFLAPLLAALGPMTRSMTAGGMVGHVGNRAFGSYELPVPRPPAGGTMVVASNIDAFAETWELDLDALRLWICVERLAYHAVLSVPHVNEEVSALLTRFARGFRSDPSSLTDQLGSLDPMQMMSDPSAMESLFSDPQALIGAMRSPEQDEVQPRIASMLATLIGYVDHVLDTTAAKLIGEPYAMLSEALRRRRVEATEADRFVEQLLGVELERETVEAGQRFVAGVIERAGDAGLARLWEAPGRLPTPNELAAPGLWLARIDLDEPTSDEPTPDDPGADDD
ncbi:MAG: zinc-dependent metalloprotease [Actinomycetota bacterium]